MANKKVCGILAESIFGAWDDGLQRVVIGIGINLHTRDFPDELLGKAGSIDAPALTRAELIAGVWQELMPLLEAPSNRSWLADYRAYSAVLHKNVGWIEGGVHHVGFVDAIDEDGALLIKATDGTLVRLFSGEISLLVDQPTH